MTYLLKRKRYHTNLSHLGCRLTLLDTQQSTIVGRYFCLNPSVQLVTPAVNRRRGQGSLQSSGGFAVSKLSV